MRFHVPKASSPTFRENLCFHKESLSTSVGKEVYKYGLGGYETETLSAAAALVSTFGIERFADVGANIGIYSLLLKSIFGHQITIDAFEPLPQLRNIAQVICVDNDLDINLRAEAASDNDGAATFYISAKSDSSNSLNPDFRKAKGTIEVITRKLDTIYSDAGVKPRLLKIDTESTEPMVLRGADNLLRFTRPWVICEVLSGRGEALLSDILRPLGYKAYHLNGSPLTTDEVIVGDPTYQHRDWLFAPEVPSDSFNEAYLEWQRSFNEVRTKN